MSMQKRNVLEQIFPIMGGNFAQAGMASVEVKSILKKTGVAPADVRRISIAVYEAEMNVVLYARKGVLTVRLSPTRVFFVLDDEGEGIEDVALAMCEGYTTASEMIRELGFGSGMGLPNIRSNADFLRITSTLKKGTRLEAGFDFSGDCCGEDCEEKVAKENSTSFYLWKRKGYRGEGT
jgi:serine/threonine-protein kinase RsbT